MVHKISNRNVYNIPLNPSVVSNKEESSTIEVYQEGGGHIRIPKSIPFNDLNLPNLLHQVDEEPLLVNPSTIPPMVPSKEDEEETFSDDDDIDNVLRIDITVDDSDGSKEDLQIGDEIQTQI